MIVKEIDFLPESYHTKRQQGRKKIWRRGILVVFLLIIGSSTIQQHFKQKNRESIRNRVIQRAATLVAQLEDAEALKRQIDLADAKVNLLTTLRVQVPPTRILEAITSHLPEFVTLTELHATYEKVQSSNPERRKTPQNRTKPENTDEPGELADVKQLISRRKETALYVSLKGVAPNDIVVARYLALLHETDVFDEALLEITEGEVYQGYRLRRFGVRLKVIRPDDNKRTLQNQTTPNQIVPEPALAKKQRRKTIVANDIDNPSATVERPVR